jgi:hypothetical protein
VEIALDAGELAEILGLGKERKEVHRQPLRGGRGEREFPGHMVTAPSIGLVVPRSLPALGNGFYRERAMRSKNN